MTGVYSRRRLVLVVALVVALLTNPLLAVATGSGGSESGSDEIDGVSDIGTVDLPIDDPLDDPLDDDTTTPTPTSTESTTDTPTTDDGLGDVVDDIDDGVGTIVNETRGDDDDPVNGTLEEANETLDDANETVDDTVENASEGIEETLNDTEETLEGANETLGKANETVEDAEGTLEDETDDAANSLGEETDDVTVNVTVEDASAGETVEVAVPSTESDVSFDDLAIDVERDGGFDLAVTSSRDRFTAPNLTGSPGTVALGYVQLEHTIADADVGNVTITFGVDASRFENADLDPEDVALYRYSDGFWTELPTELVSQEDGQYVYSAESPGLSEFAAGAKRPAFEVPTATVETEVIDVGDDVAVRVQIENHGGADGVYTATLSFDGEAVDSRDVSVAAGGSRIVTFREVVDSPGTYAVSINELRAGEVTVRAAGTTGGTSTVDDPAVATGGQPGFGPLVALVGLLVASSLVRRDAR